MRFEYVFAQLRYFENFHSRLSQCRIPNHDVKNLTDTDGHDPVNYDIIYLFYQIILNKAKYIILFMCQE